MTERTWALLIICTTVIFVVAIISDCIKSVKGIEDKAERLQKFDPKIWEHNIPTPLPLCKETGKSVIFEDGRKNECRER